MTSTIPLATYHLSCKASFCGMGIFPVQHWIQPRSRPNPNVKYPITFYLQIHIYFLDHRRKYKCPCKSTCDIKDPITFYLQIHIHFLDRRRKCKCPCKSTCDLQVNANSSSDLILHVLFILSINFYFRIIL